MNTEINHSQAPKNKLPFEKITISKDDRCGICSEILLDQDKKTLKKKIMKSEDLGVVHDACFLPFHKEDTLCTLIQARCYSMGDTISITPVIRELNRIYPTMKITVMSFYPDIFIHNPYVNFVLDMNKPISEAMVKSHHFILDSFKTDGDQPLYHFAMHSSEFASICALNKSIIPTDWQYDLFYGRNDYDFACNIFREHGINHERDRVILINPHLTEWPTRDWGRYKFQELAHKIKMKYPDHKLVSLGGGRKEVPSQFRKNYVHIDGAIDLFEKCSILQSAAIMDLPCIKLMITPDTGSLHLAATRRELPIVGVFTLIKSYMRTPIRNQRFGYKFIGVESDSGCNCTYDVKALTNEMNFSECPKNKFLNTVSNLKIPQHIKTIGLENALPDVDWDKNNLNSQIKEQLKSYRPDNLLCFPSVDKVMLAVDKALRDFNDAN